MDGTIQNPNVFHMVEDIYLGTRQNPAFGLKNTITSKHGYFKGVTQVIYWFVAEGCLQWVGKSPAFGCNISVRF